MSNWGPEHEPAPPPDSLAALMAHARADARPVHPFDWAILGAGVLSLVFSFFSYYSYSADRAAVAAATNIPRSTIDQICADPTGIPSAGRADVDKFCNGVSSGAWHGFFGWFGVLLAVLGAALVAIVVFAPHVSLPVPPRVAALGSFALALVSTLVALAVIPNNDDVGNPGGAGGVSYDNVVDESHGFSYWIVLILLVVGLMLAVLRLQQTGGTGAAQAIAPGWWGAPPPGYPPPVPGQPQGYPPVQQGPPGYTPPPTAPPPAPPPAPPVPPPPGAASH